MIASFATKETEALFHGLRPRRFPEDVCRAAMRKLLMLNAAVDIRDLRIPPGNRLEALKGKRKGQYSIRITDRWRVCFRFEQGQAIDVEITDYHR